MLEFLKNREPRDFILVLILAGLLRLYHLGYFSVWFDEAASWYMSSLPMGRILEVSKIDNTPPIYHILMHYWLKTGLNSDFALRFPAMIFGFATVFMTYKLGRLIFEHKVALLAALLVAISFPGLHYSQENRMYSLQMFLSLVSTYYYLKGLRENRLKHWIYWLISGIILFYNHLFVVFLFIAQWLYFLLKWKAHRGCLRNWSLANLVLICACVPWLPVILRQMGAIQEKYWVPPARPVEIIKIFIHLTSVTYLFGKSVQASIIHLPIFLSFLSGLYFIFKRDLAEKYLVPIFIFIPLIIVYAISIGRQSLFYYRYLLFLVPFIYYIISLGVLSLARKYLRYGLITLLFAVSLYYLLLYYTRPEYSQPQRLPMKQVMQVIDQNSSPGDGIIHQGVIDNWGIETFFISLRYNQRKFKDYLWRSEKLPFYFGRPFMPQDAIMTDLDKCTHHQRLWVLTINFGRSTDEQGLPICPEKNELYLKISSVTPDQLWSELKQRGFLLKTLEKYDRLLLCQFVKSEG